MIRRKTPGTDGLPVEFYATYINLLAPKLVALYGAAREARILPVSTREALVVPILKPGKDAKDPTAYRPLSMLNMDYKILSRILATRLLPFMPKLIHPDQTGFIPGRSTAVNIRRLLMQMDSDNYNAETTAVLAVDIKKAFDSLEWRFLYQVMERMNLGVRFGAWTALLYTDPSALVRTGRLISDKYSVERGTRQGCP